MGPLSGTRLFAHLRVEEEESGTDAPCGLHALGRDPREPGGGRCAHRSADGPYRQLGKTGVRSGDNPHPEFKSLHSAVLLILCSEM